MPKIAPPAEPTLELPPSMALAAHRAKLRFNDRIEGREGPCLLPPEWSELATEIDGGWWPGLHIVVGNTGTGKTQFAVQCSRGALHSGAVVLYLTLELPEHEIVYRHLAQELGVSWSDIELARDARLQPIVEQAHKIERLPLYIREVAPLDWHYKDMMQDVRAIREKHGPEARILVIVDYLQAVGGERAESLRERIKGAAYSAVAVARQYDVATLLLSSTARENYAMVDPSHKTTNKGNKPGQGNASRMIGLGKESGDIEYAARNLLVLCRGEEEGQTWIALAKCRTGHTGWYELYFDGEQGLFTQDGPAPVNKRNGIEIARGRLEVGTVYGTKELRKLWAMSLADVRIMKDKLLQEGDLRLADKANHWVFGSVTETD